MVCLDEKPIQLHDHVREPKGLRPGKCRRVDYEYKRNGTCNAFCCVEPKVGVYSVNITDHRKAEDFCRANQRDSGKLSKGRKDDTSMVADHDPAGHQFARIRLQSGGNTQQRCRFPPLRRPAPA